MVISTGTGFPWYVEGLNLYWLDCFDCLFVQSHAQLAYYADALRHAVRVHDQLTTETP